VNLIAKKFCGCSGDILLYNRCHDERRSGWKCLNCGIEQRVRDLVVKDRDVRFTDDGLLFVGLEEGL